MIFSSKLRSVLLKTQWFNARASSLSLYEEPQYIHFIDSRALIERRASFDKFQTLASSSLIICSKLHGPYPPHASQVPDGWCIAFRLLLRLCVIFYRKFVLLINNAVTFLLFICFKSCKSFSPIKNLRTGRIGNRR